MHLLSPVQGAIGLTLLGDWAKNKFMQPPRAPLFWSILLLWLGVPSWSTVARLPLLGPRPDFSATPVRLYPAAPANARLGNLVFDRGYRLTSPDPSFGGFSSLIVTGDRFLLLSDGGNIVRFRLDSTGQLHDRDFAELPGGPGTGWEKSDRDSESMTRDPASGTIWVGFENANAIWAYRPGLRKALRHATPKSMQDWPTNGGAEAMVRLHDGSFLVLSETGHWGTNISSRHDRAAIRFSGDPTRNRRQGFRFSYRPPPGFNPTDIAELPDGQLLVLNRRFGLPSGFTAVLTLVDPRAIAPGKTVQGRVIARFARAVLSDNYEGIAVVREADGGIGLWIVSDDNQSHLQQSLLLHFRLDVATFGARNRVRHLP